MNGESGRKRPAPIDRARRARNTDTDNAALSRLDSSTPGPGAAGEEEEPTPRGSDAPAAPAGPPPRDMTDRPLQAPIRLALILRCPSCNESATVEATLSARVVKDSDGTGHLSLRTRAAKVGHVCGQIALGLVEGPRVR